jgi:endoglucanase
MCGLTGFFRIGLALSLWLVCYSVAADCNNARQLKGVNLAGAEFNGNKLPGKQGTDYIYPSPEDIQHFHKLGMNTIRLPFLWERIQPKLFSELDAKETASIRSIVELAKSLDMCVVLDVHNYGAYRGSPLGSDAVPDQAFIDLWQRLGKAFNDPKAAAFGLMNEPHKVPAKAWYPLAQKVVNQLRAQGNQNLILVPSARWSGAHEWAKPVDGSSSAAEAFQKFSDPANNYAIEVHQYADPDHSGTHDSCIEAARLQAIMAEVTGWGKAQHRKFFLGEFGTPANQPCLVALKSLVNGMADDRVWRGWTYWAAGKWWRDYSLSVQPKDGIDAEQIRVLKSDHGG